MAWSLFAWKDMKNRFKFWSRADKSKFGWFQIGNRIISKMPYCSKVWAIRQRIKNNYWAIQNWTFSNLFYLGICFSVFLILDQLQYTIIIIKVLTIFQTLIYMSQKGYPWSLIRAFLYINHLTMSWQTKSLVTEKR